MIQINTLALSLFWMRVGYCPVRNEVELKISNLKGRETIVTTPAPVQNDIELPQCGRSSLQWGYRNLSSL